MKYKNLTILFKNKINQDQWDGGTYTVDYSNVVISITGDHLILTEHSEDGLSITGTVLPLNTIISYKANKE